jgi:hypothetical protein
MNLASRWAALREAVVDRRVGRPETACRASLGRRRPHDEMKKLGTITTDVYTDWLVY